MVCYNLITTATVPQLKIQIVSNKKLYYAYSFLCEELHI